MAKEVAPICEVTGLPLPILPPGPRENGAFLYPRLPANFPQNDHHVWFDEKKIKALGEGGEALQNSRTQTIDWYYHKNYHEMFGSLSRELSENENEHFGLTVSAVAGVVPRMAVDVSKRGEYKIVELAEDQHIQIAEKLSIDNRKPIAKFLADYAMKQQVTDVIDEIIIEEFLDERTENTRKYEIARTMLGGVIDLSLESLNLYAKEKEIKSQGLIVRPKPRTFYWTAKSLVRNHFEYFATQAQEHLATS